ncbi:MAG TPA: cytosolic protein [Planctomycetes bacterium]|nr:cytosolic protein [Planctomycetota bacterium]
MVVSDPWRCRVTPGTLNKYEITKYIEDTIPNFHQRRLESLLALNLKKVLQRKNPYLFRAKNINTASELVKGILDAYLSSQEETIFGGFLEGLAIFICSKVYGGWKSSAEGIDLEFDKDGTRYIVTIKSGPNWGNSGQISKMKENFRKARRILRTSAGVTNVEAVNGCCYGRENSPEKGEYLKLCGECFWTFISGRTSLYMDIIKPLGNRAKEKNEEFLMEYGKAVNRFVRQFIDEFCSEDGLILWDKLLKFNSSATA